MNKTNDKARNYQTNRPGKMDRAAFLDVFGPVYEHSPWIAEGVFNQGLTRLHDTPDGLHAALVDVVEVAGREAQLNLLLAHPDLAGKLAVQGKLTEESKSEQAGAGLDQCTPEEFQIFQDTNTRYREKFGFPFILAVRGRKRPEILAALQTRVENDTETEFAEALSQVHQIARLRLDLIE